MNSYCLKCAALKVFNQIFFTFLMCSTIFALAFLEVNEKYHRNIDILQFDLLQFIVLYESSPNIVLSLGFVVCVLCVMHLTSSAGAAPEHKSLFCFKHLLSVRFRSLNVWVHAHGQGPGGCSFKPTGVACSKSEEDVVTIWLLEQLLFIEGLVS